MVIDSKLRDLGDAICEEAKRHQSEFILELGGHNKRGSVSEWYIEKQVDGFQLLIYKNIEHDLRLLLKALRRGGRTRKPIEFGKTCLDRCYVCGKRIGITFDGKIFGAETVCQYPDGLPEYSMRLAVPSGKIVAGNDFRDEYEPCASERIVYGTILEKELESFRYDVDTDMGCRQVFMFYAKRGLAHGFIGNSCPGVYRIDDDTLTISQCRHDEDYKITDLPGDHVGGICTDLWWYSLADYDDLARRCGGDPSKGNDVIDVKPGTYRVTHRTHKVNRDDNVTDHYAVIKRIKRT
jgi:hypothetical protein